MLEAIGVRGRRMVELGRNWGKEKGAEDFAEGRGELSHQIRTVCSDQISKSRYSGNRGNR
jgi:hypothetical protein